MALTQRSANSSIQNKIWAVTCATCAIYTAKVLAAILEGERKYLGASLQLTPVRAGLFTNGMSTKEVETAAKAANVETLGLHRITIGMVLGFLPSTSEASLLSPQPWELHSNGTFIKVALT